MGVRAEFAFDLIRIVALVTFAGHDGGHETIVDVFLCERDIGIASIVAVRFTGSQADVEKWNQ